MSSLPTEKDKQSELGLWSTVQQTLDHALQVAAVVLGRTVSPANVGLLSLHFQGRRTHTAEAKTAQKRPFYRGNTDFCSEDCSSKSCEKKKTLKTWIPTNGKTESDLDSTSLVIFILFLPTVGWTLFSAFSFLKRGHSFKSALIWDCAYGTSVLHCHCVFKLFLFLFSFF